MKYNNLLILELEDWNISLPRDRLLLSRWECNNILYGKNYDLSFEFHEKLFVLYRKYVKPNTLELVDVIFSFGLVK